MSNVIRFLETMGKDATLARFSQDEYAAMVASLDIEGDARQALLDRDAAALNDALGGRAKMYCYIAAPIEEPLRSPDEPDGDGDDDQEKPGDPGKGD